MSPSQVDLISDQETQSNRLGAVSSEWDQNPGWLQDLANEIDDYLTPIEIEMAELEHWSESSHPFSV